MSKTIISTTEAPAAIGTYSQATRHGNTVYLSGQIPLHPQSMTIVDGGIEAQVNQVFTNLRAVCIAAGADLDAILKLTVYLTDMAHFPQVNSVMAEYFSQPYPARAAVGVATLPRGAQVEIDAILGL
jgi:reactive intermediate/imine deaminase